MTHPEITTLDEYEVYLTERMTPWSLTQQIALGAAIAEHWLPAYEAFSAKEEWGDPVSMRRSLEAVWGHMQGRLLNETNLARHIQQIEEITPHMDDFDAEEALIACITLMDAIRSCGEGENTIPYVARLAMGVFEGLVDEWPLDSNGQQRVWQKSAVRKELQTQLKLIEEIEAISSFDAESVKQLRNRLSSLKVKVSKRPKPKTSPGLTNQTAFEQYRRYVESDLKGQMTDQAEPEEDSYLFGITYLGYWLSRYSRRLQTINGSYGKLADVQGQQALLNRNRALDAKEKGVLEWDPEVYEVIEMCLKNNSQLQVVDANSVETPHAYGPSIRRLWLEGRRVKSSPLDAWKHIRVWASHRPLAWKAEDGRKKKGFVYSSGELGEKLALELSWDSTSDPIFPWATVVAGNSWKIQINDFPDEWLYSLVMENEFIGNFHDWPETWQRPAG